MEKILSCELTDLSKNAGNSYDGVVRVYNAKFDLAARAAADLPAITADDLLKLCDKPHGGVLLAIVAVSDTAQTATFSVNGQSKDSHDAVKTLAAAKYGTVKALEANAPILVVKPGAGEQTLYDEEITLTPDKTLGTSGILEFKVFVGLV